MKIVILKDLKELGKKGDIKEVSNGYAQNFLIPQGFGRPATQTVLKDLDKRKQLKQKKNRKQAEKNKEVFKKLEGMSIGVRAKADDKGHLFGSVTADQILQRLKKKGLVIEKNKIKIPEQIKRLGNYKIIVELDSEHKTEIHLIVEAEK